jgi:hypothetical protein
MWGFVAFIAMNVLLCIGMSRGRGATRRIDLAAVGASAAVSTVILHIIAIILDTKSSMWLMISVPIAFGVGFLVSSGTSLCAQHWKRKHAPGKPS